MPKMLAMKPRGSCYIRLATILDAYQGNDAYKDNRHDGEDDNGSTLPHGLLCLLGGLPSLEDRSLLLLEIEEVIQLYGWPISKCPESGGILGLTLVEVLSALFLSPSSSPIWSSTSLSNSSAELTNQK